MGSHETKAATPVPPAKRQRRPAALARRVPSVQAASDATASAAGENGRKFSATRNPGSSKGTPATAATVPASATGRSSTASAAASSAKGAEGAAAVHRQLAPRQTSPPGDAVSKQDLEASAASATQSSRSGSNTPPGLSVLAKIAQKQAPIQVKLEELAPQQQQLRPIAQATSPNHRAQQNPRALAQGAPPPRQPPLCASSHQQPQPVLLPPAGAGETVAQKRQERLIKNRAAALLSRKRKREYMGKLESEIEDLRDSNTSLAQRLADMEARLSALAAERDELRRENASVRAASSLAAGASSASSSGSTTAAGSEGTKADGGKEPAAAEPAPPTAEKPGDAAGDRGGEKRRMADGPAKGGKQRAAGALLMAVLFSFSLFTLPSLYTPDSQIAAGGVQSGGMLPPVRALPPSAAERRLLIGDAAGGPHGLSEHAVAGSPLLERVRRSISELAQQVDGAQAPGNASDDAVLPRARPMSMEQSAGLHAWIKHGLAAAQAQAADSARECAPEQPLSSLSVVHSMPPHGRGSHRDYAMLYCPSMQHVLLGAGLERHHVAASEPAYQPSAPRVIHADAVPDNPPAASSSADDVDDGLPASGLLPPPPSPKPMDAGSADLLVPTQAAAFHHSLLAQRPKMSLYSPVVARGSGLDVSEHADILAPWEEYASSDSSTGRSSIGARQKYLRIDVEVVGSRWVTADKFASGLY
ncbi:hypothetical protein H4R26_002619 [Coemansia thaxteri]|uniref:BZIP domain-containing protein n=1 Tax=Coemansia thaxteri TaxID=2663907 RepID=A0A9W8BJN3_9FUNG|nr:hypothetical protein H4R26_002619 [Coemansia thaxteri]KAJ2478145.1 hypothetical protein EV174_004405 [Coemansia sp. RSA 2320]